MADTPTQRVLPFLLLFVLSAAIFLGGLGRFPLLGRDESLYAEAAREMAASGDWVTPRVNGGPFFEKPPLYYWMAGASVKAFGVSPFAVRLPAALAAILTVLLTAAIGARVWGRRAGLLAGLALATCLQMGIIGRMGIMDVPLALLVTLALLAYARWASTGGFLPAAAFGACVGLGVLLKGGAGLLPVAVAAVDEYWRRVFRPTVSAEPERPALRTLVEAVCALAVCAAVAAPWFLVMNARHGEVFGGTLLVHEHLQRILRPMQGHGGPFWVYLPVIFLGFFPWVVFVPGGMGRGSDEESAAKFRWRRLCVIWVAVVLVGFSGISTKLPGYVTPLHPAMALLVGAELDRRLSKPGWAPWVSVIIGGLGLAALTALLPGRVRPLAATVGAEGAVAQLAAGVMVWMAAYLLVVLGALIVLARAEVGGLSMIAVGQLAALGAVLIGILPIVSPHLEGGREYRVAQEARILEHARRQDTSGITLLYDTRPEAVAFVLQHPVPVFDRDHQAEMLAELRARLRSGSSPPAAGQASALVIAPAKDQALFEEFAVDELASVGDRMLLDVRPAGQAWPVQ